PQGRADVLGKKCQGAARPPCILVRENGKGRVPPGQQYRRPVFSHSSSIALRSSGILQALLSKTAGGWVDLRYISCLQSPQGRLWCKDCNLEFRYSRLNLR